MYRKEVNERSPLRVFEKSIHGGLGKGNLGVVMSRPGVGKTAFLVGVGLDDLMRSRKVLHISLDNPVERVRAFYELIYKEQQINTSLEDAAQVHQRLEMNRMIHVYNSGELSIEKLERNTTFLRNHANFEPDVVIIDGVDFKNTSNTELSELKDLAETLQAEFWLSAVTHRDNPPKDPRGIDDQVICFDDYISVMVLLHPEEEGSVTIQLLKDHENEDLAELNMKLDPKTLLFLAEK